jgi:endonuclease-3
MVRALDPLFGGEAWARRRRRSDPLDTLIRAILSQNTNDDNRDQAYRALKERFPTWEMVLKAGIDDLKETIRVAGLANQKGPTIQAVLSWLQLERGELELDFLCELPEEEAVEILTSHKGVGIKTAYIVLAFACGKDLCAVDTHVHRILRRMGVVDERCGREKAHIELAVLIPKGKARSFHVNLIDFGKTICTARKPDCKVCPLRRQCQYFNETQGA